MLLTFNRRLFLAGLAAAIAVGFVPSANAQEKPKKILFFTKSSGFQHSVIARKGDNLSHAERILTELGKKNGYEVICSKDGGMFESDKIGQFDAFVFETTGDLTQTGTDKQPAMSPQGEKNLYEAIKSGKGFVGFHCATDTFGHHRGKGADDPYIQMIGGEFAGHGAQQDAKLGVADADFPGAKAFGTDEFTLYDEWYGIKNINPDLHVIYYYKTAGMKGKDYERPNFPQTWARLHGKGRVFYNSMGHKEEVWSNDKFQDLAVAALDWATGKVNADIPTNLTKVTPEYQVIHRPAVKAADNPAASPASAK